MNTHYTPSDSRVKLCLATEATAEVGEYHQRAAVEEVDGGRLLEDRERVGEAEAREGEVEPELPSAASLVREVRQHFSFAAVASKLNPALLPKENDSLQQKLQI